ncbi:protein PHTF2-like isoform X4 [Portunus trituberculatus]|uniref:protein PHTF2-like isoform X4 n=1 Tax=Portunus trituberculatus TaxID=210409 RepID=UPI001E1CF4B4|nr:protein PHTF2-like isoform X4 [Portunus trituberculatus]
MLKKASWAQLARNAVPPIIMMVLESALGWYQGRISLYDKQSWETTVEQRILQGLSYTPRKTANPKTEFIDVDLVRGSTFPKAKPHSGLWLAGLHGIARIALLPLYPHWWVRETSFCGFLVVLFIYCSIVYCSAVVLVNRNDEHLMKDLSVSEAVLPAVALVMLSIIHSQIVCTRHPGGPSSPSHSARCLSVRCGVGRRTARLVRRSVAMSGRGKNVVCDCWKRDVAKLTSGFIKKSTTPVKTRSLKNFRSHSEEPRGEEPHPPRPRSASENCVSPASSSTSPDVQPQIIIFKARGEGGGEVEEQGTTTSSSSDRSPDIHSGGPEDGKFFSSLSAKSSPNPSYTSQSENEDTQTVISPSQLATEGDEGDSGLEGTTETARDERTVTDKHLKLPLPSVRHRGHCRKVCQHDESGEGEEALYAERWRGMTRCHNHHPPPAYSCCGAKKFPVSVERSSCNSSCESDGEQSPTSQYSKSKHSEFEWTGITTNSDDLSYSSDSEGGWDDQEDGPRSSQPPGFLRPETLDWNIQGSPAAIITATPNVSVKVSCKIFEGVEVKKVDLSVLDISSAVISKVDSLRHTTVYLQFGLTMAIVIALVPSLCRLNYGALVTLLDALVTQDSQDWPNALSHAFKTLLSDLFGSSAWASSVILLSCINRFLLASGFFFLLSVAERTFKQRFLYAKHFCYLTSARRARKYDLPHFRLNKVHNIKTWLSVRSCLRKRGPQRSVDVIVSATFALTLLLVCYLCFELLREDEKLQNSMYSIELFLWCFAIGIYLIRFMTLGAMINKKYSSLSVLITEQINMYLHMEQKPQKKDELTLANNVLKLVSVLLKELESPFKISGLSANPLLYNVTKLVVLSACSGVLSDLLGFKLKLHKIKFK